MLQLTGLTNAHIKTIGWIQLFIMRFVVQALLHINVQHYARLGIQRHEHPVNATFACSIAKGSTPFFTI